MDDGSHSGARRNHAAVVETSPGFLEDTVRAGVLVDEVNGMAVRPFRVYFLSLPQALPGECFSARVEFAELEENEYTYGNYADGIFLAGEYLDGFLPQGESGALWARAKRVQAALSMALRKVLAQPYAGAAAAMTAGDRAGGVRSASVRSGRARLCGGAAYGAAQAGLRLRHVFLSGFYVPHGFYTLCCARGYGNAAALRGRSV